MVSDLQVAWTGAWLRKAVIVGVHFTQGLNWDARVWIASKCYYLPQKDSERPHVAFDGVLAH